MLVESENKNSVSVFIHSKAIILYISPLYYMKQSDPAAVGADVNRIELHGKREH